MIHSESELSYNVAMKFEFSAGGVVFKKENAAIYVLVAQHSQHHGWVFPKGLIGDHKKGETKEATALREVEEETGAIGKILQPLHPETFWYQLNGEKIKKTVYYFVMEYVDGDITKHDFEMEHVEWLPAENVAEKLTYLTDRKVWEEAKKYILSIH